MPLQVIGAGFGRTGTLSLKHALEQLYDKPCYHMEELILRRPEHRPLWLRISRGEAVEWEDVFADYDAAVDWPAAAYWRALHARYPEAKVVLTIRDPARWHDSALSTIYRTKDMLTTFPMRLFARRMLGMEMLEMTQNVIWEGHFKGRFADAAYAQQVFLDHIEEVKAAIPAEQLLVFEVKEGWGPLCAFLGKEVPAEPFPNVNDREEFERRFTGMKVITWAMFAVSLAAAAGLVLGALKLAGVL